MSNCQIIYIEIAKKSVNVRLTEDKRSCRLGQTEKLAVAEHTTAQENHKILFSKTQILANLIAQKTPFSIYTML